MELGLVEVLQDYGWFILGGAVIVALLWSKVRPNVDHWLLKRSEAQYAAKYHKDPDVVTQMLTAQQQRTDKLQAEYEKNIELFKEKEKKKEAMKREEILKKAENQSGHVLGEGVPSTSKNSGYNPLMGDHTRTYKPVRKSPCSGGGCGR